MLKKIFIGVGILFVLLIGAIITLPIIFKDKIVAKVKEEANKNLNAKLDFGAFDLSLLSSFPDFRFELNDLLIVGVDSFAGDTLLGVKQMKLDIDLMSIIKGEQYKINSIVLDHPSILAKVLKSGKANWDITKPSADTTASTAEESSPFKMTIKKFEIINGNIVYDDAMYAFLTALKGLNHTLSGDFTQDNFLLETMTTIDQFDMTYDGVKYLNKVKTEIKADLDADMPLFKFTFKNNEFKLNDLAIGLDGYFAMPKEDMDMDLKISTKKTDFKSILSLVPGAYTKDFEGVKASGKLSLEAFIKGIYNEKIMPAFGVKLLVENGMFQYPSLPKSVNNIHIDVNVNNKDGVPDHTITDINKFHLEMAGNPVDIKMHIATPVSDMSIDGDVKGKLDLSSVKEYIPLEADQQLSGNITADINLKGKMSAIEKEKYDEFDARGQFIILGMNYKSKDVPYGVMINRLYMNFSPQYVELSAFESMLGKSDVNAKGRLENFLAYAFKDETLKGNLSLSSNLMDLNELMGEEESATTAAPEDTAPLSVVEIPANIDFVMNASFGKLLYDNMEMKNVSGALIVRNSEVKMENLKMNLLDGSMVVNGSYATRDVKNPTVDFDLQVTDFDISKTVKTFNTVEKLAPVAKSCIGKFSTTMQFACVLDKEMSPVLPTLQGKGKLQTRNMVLMNFEPINKVADAIKMEKYKKMDLKDVNVSYAFKDGKVEVEPFDVKLGNSNVNIGGSNGFDQSIDYKMKFVIPRSEFGGQANAMLGGLVAQANSKAGSNMSLGEKVSLDVLVGGTVTNPVVKTGLKDAASDAVANVKEQVKDELNQKKKEAEEKVRAEADKLKKEAEDKARAEADRLKKEAEDKAKAEAERLKKEAEAKAKNEAKNKLKDVFGKPKK
jgi:hypothetical protein